MSNSATMSARQRIESLVDANSFVEIGGLVTKRNTDFNMQEKSVPADGVITGCGIVDSNLVYVYSQDAAAMNGSVGEMHARKIAALYEMAVKAGAPVIELIDCAGIRVQEAMDALAGFGDIYMAKVKASGVIPQISAILGSCGGGVAVAAQLSDITLMDGGEGRLFVNSPNALDGNHVDKLDSASSQFQAEAGNVDIVCDSEEEVLAQIRRLIHILPANAATDATEEPADDLNRSLPGFDNYATDAGTALENIADGSEFIELKKDYGREMVVGFMKLAGVTVGALANSAEGVLSAAGCSKAEQFLYFCDSFGLPVITLTNVKSYASSVGEEREVARAVAGLTYAFASADVPKINLITGEAYGSAYVAMNSRHIGADYVMALSTAKVGVMDATAAARVMCEDEVNKAENTADALKEKAKEYDALQSGAEAAARRGYVDNVIEGESVRKHLIYALQMFGMR